MEQIIATVLFICISSINNKRSLLRFQSTTAPTNRGWSACAVVRCLFQNYFWRLFHVIVFLSFISHPLFGIICCCSFIRLHLIFGVPERDSHFNIISVGCMHYAISCIHYCASCTHYFNICKHFL